MRSWYLAFPLLLTLSLTASGFDPRPVLGEPDMQATRVALDPGDPARVRTGRLTYLGGVRLSSRDSAFGSFSAMLLEGDRFTLVSDRGNVVRFRMGADFVPREIAFADLPGGPGRGWLKRERDAESMARDPATGKVWIAFESASTIWRYAPGLARHEAEIWPRAMREWTDNKGPESMARLPDGAFVILAEGRAKGGGHEGLRWSGDPLVAPDAVVKFRYVPPPGYEPSDAAALPDGRILVLNRRFEVSRALFSAKLTVIDSRAIRPGAVLRGAEVGTLARPLLHDNFEALAVSREGDATIVWIASDDNQQFWERTLLLKFRLEPGQAKSPLPAPETGSR